MDLNFLDNVHVGKNSWWRYVLSILSIGIGGLVGVISAVILVFIIFILPSNFNNMAMISSNLASESDNLVSMVSTFSFIFGVLFFSLSVRFIHKNKFKNLITSYENVRWKNILKGMVLWFVIVSLVTVINFILYPFSYHFTFNTNNFGSIFILSLLAVPLAASFEEVLFRGYLMQAFSLLTRRPLLLLIITSLIFSLIHYGKGIDALQTIYIVVGTGIMGLMLGAITIGEGGIETAVGIHSVNNLFVIFICNDATTGINNVPSLLTIYATYTPYDYMVGIIMSMLMAIALLILLFWGKFYILKEIFSLKKFDY